MAVNWTFAAYQPHSEDEAAQRKSGVGLFHIASRISAG
jgi:hypothetical protein